LGFRSRVADALGLGRFANEKTRAEMLRRAETLLEKERDVRSPFGSKSVAFGRNRGTGLGAKLSILRDEAKANLNMQFYAELDASRNIAGRV
jgi:hypothetical protein